MEAHSVGWQSCAREATGSSSGQHHKVMVAKRQMTVYEMWGSEALACFL